MKIVPLVVPTINWSHLKELSSVLEKLRQPNPIRVLDEAKLSNESYFKYLAFFELLVNSSESPRKLVQQSFPLLEHLAFTFLVYAQDYQLLEIRQLPIIHFLDYGRFALASANLLEWKHILIETLLRDPTSQKNEIQIEFCSEIYKCLKALNLQELFVKFNSTEKINGSITFTRR